MDFYEFCASIKGFRTIILYFFLKIFKDVQSFNYGFLIFFEVLRMSRSQQSWTEEFLQRFFKNIYFKNFRVNNSWFLKIIFSKSFRIIITLDFLGILVQRPSIILASYFKSVLSNQLNKAINQMFGLGN